MESLLGVCPDSYYCEDGNHGYAAITSKLLVIHGVGGVVSAVLSIVGATTILLAYCALLQKVFPCNIQRFWQNFLRF